MKVIFLLFVVAFVSVSANSALVPFIEPCGENDERCLVRSAQNALPVMSGGVPSLGINPLDPLHVDKVHTDNAGLTMDRSGKHMELTLRGSLVMAGDYTMSGKLLVMAIEGDGKYRIRIRDMVTKVMIEFGERRVGRDSYWTVDSWKHTFNVETGADFRFQNLFNGNKQLSDAIHEFANSNWREIFQEVAPPMVEKTVGMIVQEVTKLFDKVPIRELVKH
ncbi:unnamed protein product [Diatraea saccharalis]|uniref:Uncharacterized protein n=1 Tax=Diatraea saccharalis TaxID=40085 RepID=A0A9N9WCN0_9NEOP|nr:unnamed protein product [Diatraea saccharalis]